MIILNGYYWISTAFFTHDDPQIGYWQKDHWLVIGSSEEYKQDEFRILDHIANYEE